ncbi:hypothetical protein [Sphingomonas sp. BK069]|uniref:hypothetical protein n=1 Tax=Sphingomonas sp. BK069 TaxID=2586979 RepID=UPI00160DA6D7|nr:hypothetical protein [Sphingomonas sp. BK069]MBB3345969.1 FAD/FMN-containing dehydrogenase [Sphingomonas sp. BK069]
MRLMDPTRTLNPLPFEHLDPRRFEDLVRQLAYDFRPWQVLEATGRSGADAGFDARAVEVGRASGSGVADGEDKDEADSSARLWLIQCKRERAIGPAKIVKHLEDIPKISLEDLHGLIFAAACDFSLATREACRNWCRRQGIQEIHLWGRGEIEDQLFQSKNDNLLFAYFGISLHIRRQGTATRIRREIALKRKIRQVQDRATWPGAAIILRDPSDDRYPHVDAEGWRRGDYRWRPVWSCGAGTEGLRIIIRQHYGYFDPDTGNWDFASAFNASYPREAEDLWIMPEVFGNAQEIVEAWSSMPRRNQVHFRLIGTIPYSEIIEIDQEPDDFSDLPLVYTTFRPWPNRGFEPPYTELVTLQVETSLPYQEVAWIPERHVRAFPESMRDLDWEASWTERNGWTLSDLKVPFPSN